MFKNFMNLLQILANKILNVYVFSDFSQILRILLILLI